MTNMLLTVTASALLLAQAATAQTNSGDFSILSMNVAGLPEALQSNDVPGDKKTNSGLVGSYFAEYGFDVIHVQEDFNYHAYIYETDDHPYRSATSGGVPAGSGLNTLANFPWVDLTRTKWDTCSNIDSNDCLTPKGFTFMRVQLAASADNHSTAVYADFYNLHADAGTTKADETARNSNINQVLAYAEAWSAGNAVLLYGDTNSRYSRTADTAIRSLLASNFTDAWVQLERDGVVPTVESMCVNPQAADNSTCETVDKVFYRSSPLVSLDATSFMYAGTRFLQPDGNVTTDHNPINVNLTWTTGLQQSGYWGGPHGDWFSDVDALSSIASPAVTGLVFRGEERLDSVGVELSGGTNLTHGGAGGKEAALSLGEGEYWTGATLCQGQYNGETRNFYIHATTSEGNTLSAGGTTDDCADFTAPDGWAIVGFLGQEGDEIDQLAFVYARQA